MSRKNTSPLAGVLLAFQRTPGSRSALGFLCQRLSSILGGRLGYSGVLGSQLTTNLREVKPMACNSCGSENQQQFPSEMVIHLPGLKNVNKPPVLAFPNLRICMDCGSTKLAIPEFVVRQLGEGAAAPRLQISLTQRSSVKPSEFVAESSFSTGEIETSWTGGSRRRGCEGHVRVMAAGGIGS